MNSKNDQTQTQQNADAGEDEDQDQDERERSESVAQSENRGIHMVFVRAEYDWQTGDKLRGKMISKSISVLQPARDRAKCSFRELACGHRGGAGQDVWQRF